LFLNQVAETNKIPLSFDYAGNIPNADTIQALMQGSADYQAGKLTGYKAEEATQALLEELRG
jgi:antitoxin component of RelBE/YafQ-DinJ toxin-antitoxin module